ncbi:MAG: hypothetical protein WCT46_06000 [Candidatus Gracilibacteria bacterium]|jgi:hypothetical protein
MSTSTEGDKDKKQNLAPLLDKMKEAIWNRRPILGEIMKKHSNKILYDYSKDFIDINPTPHLDNRKKELIKTAEYLIKNRLGENISKEIATQLTKLPLVSTADHHAPIDNPFWINSNIISSLPLIENTDPDYKYLVVFSFASVSCNNASGFPRGIEFHGGSRGSGKYIRLPILPDKTKMGVVYGMRAFCKDDLEKAKTLLEKKIHERDVEKERGEKITEILNKYFENKDVLSAPDLQSQITKINYLLWPQLFHKAKNGKTELDKKIPDLIYLEIETLVTELLINHHLKDPKSLIYKLFFDKRYQELIAKDFNNLPGAFSLEEEWGTYMFWGICENHHRVRLELKNGKLSSKKDIYQHEFTPEGVEKSLREKQIFPSMILCYLIISLYYGMKCLGGFCQVHDLTLAKKAWIKILEKLGQTEEAKGVEPIQTKELGGDGMVLSYLKTHTGEYSSATGIDMILATCDTSYENYANLAKKVSMMEIMNAILPEMYTVLYRSDERHPSLTQISHNEILKETGLAEKLANEEM